jgi:hypothetical protein
MVQRRFLERPGRVLGWLLPAVAAGLLAAVPTAAPADKALPADVAVIPVDAAMAVAFRVADLWGGDFAKPVREKLGKDVDELAATMEKGLGYRPEDIERLIVLQAAFGPGTEAFVVTLKKPYDLARVLRPLGPKTKEEKYKGKTLHVGDSGDAACLLDARTYVLAKVDPLHGLLDRPAPEKAGPLSPARQAMAEGHAFVLGLNLPQIMGEIGGRLPGEVDPYRPLLEARTAVLTADATPKTRAEAVMTFASAFAAKQAEKAFKEGMDAARAGIKVGKVALAKEPNYVQLLDVVQSVVNAAKSEVDGETLKVAAQVAIDPGPAAVLLTGAIKKERGSASRVQSANNLKQIALAFHNYHDVYKSFPPAALYDKAGKPGLSWRVLILPFIEQDNLFKKFHLDEPWDSEHNKKLLDGMPKVYQAPGAKPLNRTHYLGFVGKGTVFEGKKGIKIFEITDGTSNTILVVEAAESVPWTKPEDLPFDPDKPLPKLGGLYEGGFHAALCDGSVHFLSSKITPQTLRSAITRNGGEVLGPDF